MCSALTGWATCGSCATLPLPWGPKQLNMQKENNDPPPPPSHHHSTTTFCSVGRIFFKSEFRKSKTCSRFCMETARYNRNLYAKTIKFLGKYNILIINFHKNLSKLKKVVSDFVYDDDCHDDFFTTLTLGNDRDFLKAFLENNA